MSKAQELIDALSDDGVFTPRHVFDAVSPGTSGYLFRRQAN